MSNGDKPNSDGLPHAWLLDRMDRLETRLANHGGEMRQGFRDVIEKLEEHARDDSAVEKRVTVIETKADVNERQAVSRSTWIALAFGTPSSMLALYTLWHLSK